MSVELMDKILGHLLHAPARIQRSEEHAQPPRGHLLRQGVVNRYHDMRVATAQTALRAANVTAAARANFQTSGRFMSWLLDDVVVVDAWAGRALGRKTMTSRSATDLRRCDTDHFLPIAGMLCIIM